jgi:hypothetical protein
MLRHTKAGDIGASRYMATARKPEQAAAGPPSRGAAKFTPPISLNPGTRLARGWRGVTHMALIHADGIE